MEWNLIIFPGSWDYLVHLMKRSTACRALNVAEVRRFHQSQHHHPWGAAWTME